MRSFRFRFPLALVLSLLPSVCLAWGFTDVTDEAGLTYEHGIVGGAFTNPEQMAGGVACADYDDDGWPDLYVVRGDIGPNLLLRNQGDGTFEDVALEAGVDGPGTIASGPVFVDWNGDGLLDLWVGSVEGSPCKLYRNDGDGTFSDVFSSSQLVMPAHTMSATFGDYDRNGTLDLFTGHWGVPQNQNPGHTWRNNGDGTFTRMDELVGIDEWGPWPLDFSFTGTYTDLNIDGWPDFLLVSDYGTSKVYLGNQDGTFADVTGPAISDQHGMGSAVGDIDGDLDLDWFVTSILHGPQGLTGNRLYRNDGHGGFADITESAGVRDGGWGWGASFADFDNDSHLDIVHVNGWYQPDFLGQTTRLFMSNGDGAFSEEAALRQCADDGQGRGLVCFDYDRDGDVDLYLANNEGPPVLYRNDGGNANHWIAVRLRDAGPNTRGIGAKVVILADGKLQLGELRAGCNFVSHDPLRVRFGLGNATAIQQMSVYWPDGGVTHLHDVPVDQTLLVARNAVSASRMADLAPIEMRAIPNPARDRTTIRFSVPSESRVSLRIVDVSGRLVRSLANGPRSAGAHTVDWDLRDSSGDPVAPGLYFADLRTGTRTARAKILHLR